MRIKIEFGPDGEIIRIHQEDDPAEVLGIKRPMFGLPVPDRKRSPPEKKPQGYLCLVQDDNGPVYTRDFYDHMPPHVRRRLAESPFNLCAACVQQAMYNGVDPYEVIAEMERILRQELSREG